MISILVSSCGDLKKAAKKKASFSHFSVCKMEVKEFSHFFIKRIDGQLKCLEQNLSLFIDIVKSDRPGHLGLSELKGYINIHFKDDIDPEILEMMDQVFKISALMFGDDPNYISKDSLTKLISIFDFLNEQLVDSEFYQFFKDKTPGMSYAEHNRRKSKIFAALTKVGHKVAQEVIVKGNRNVINIVDFMRSFHTEINKERLVKAEKLLFIKKIFLGGEESYVTAHELKNLGHMVGDISKIAFDMWNIGNVEHLDSQHEEIFNTLKSDFESLIGHLAFERYEQVRLFTIYNVFDVIDYFMPEFKKYTKYKTEILKLKEVFLESSSAAFSPNEIYILINDILLKNFKLGSYIFRTFRLNKDLLSNPNHLNSGARNNIFLNPEEREYRDVFNDIVKNYKYFLGSEIAPYYSYNYKRSAYGMVEIAIFENLMKKVMAFYGDKKMTARGGYRLTLEQITHMVNEFGGFLIGEKIMREGYLDDSAKTITLISTLFQAHSDGDGDIEVNEMVEFIINVYSAFKISGVLDERLTKVCDLDNQGRYTPTCYRSHFKSMMHLKSKKGKRILDHFPKLYQFLISTDFAGRIKYYKKVSKFTRTCIAFNDGSEVPMSRSDVFMIFSGMIAIEQTFLRYDTNKNNILDPNEVDHSYSTYAQAVKAIVPGDFLKKWSKDFYLYLMKYEKVPEVKDVGFFRALGEGADFIWYKAFRNKQTTATRYTLATVLRVIDEQSESKPFDCETLR